MCRLFFLLFFIVPSYSAELEDIGNHRWSQKDNQSIQLLTFKQTDNSVVDFQEYSSQQKQTRHSILRACSSFAKHPMVQTFNSFGLAVLTIGTLYHVYETVFPGYQHSVDTVQAQYLINYQSALNDTMSDNFPQSLKFWHCSRTWDTGGTSRGCAPLYMGVNESDLHGCYSKCEFWGTGNWTNDIFMPMDLCFNPNTSLPAYLKQTAHFIEFISRNCGHNMAHIWAPWFKENLANFTTSIVTNVINASLPNYAYFQDHYFPGIAKIKNQFAFINVFTASSFENVLENQISPTVFCHMPADIYTYDPVCIANKIAFAQEELALWQVSPQATFSAWCVTGGFMWLSFMIMMIVGLFG